MESNDKTSEISPEVVERKSLPERTVACPGENNYDEGCRVCRRDEDHANLLLCEACNDEYHTYCLEPPLQSVPDDDWFCGEHTPIAQSLSIMSMVNCLHWMHTFLVVIFVIASLHHVLNR
jgi:hypothetical protein